MFTVLLLSYSYVSGETPSASTDGFGCLYYFSSKLVTLSSFSYFLLYIRTSLIIAVSHYAHVTWICCSISDFDGTLLKLHAFVFVSRYLRGTASLVSFTALLWDLQSETLWIPAGYSGRCIF